VAARARQAVAQPMQGGDQVASVFTYGEWWRSVLLSAIPPLLVQIPS